MDGAANRKVVWSPDAVAVRLTAEMEGLVYELLPGGSTIYIYDGEETSSFGVISSTVNNPRLVQFALKLKF